MPDRNYITFGPVPSRRLGRSLGINNIPPKICTYTCIYCQIGKTIHMQVTRDSFYEPKYIFQCVKERVQKATEAGEPIDYLSFVPDGEPTLDLNLGSHIEELKKLKIKIAVITNSSLIWQNSVREALGKADWVSVKIDTIDKKTWRKIDRPHKSLDLQTILTGIRDFSKSFSGYLVTETMLVNGVNDTREEAQGIADFLSTLNIEKAYISVPTRPPAESWVEPPKDDTINMFFNTFMENGIKAELLIDYEGNNFVSTGIAEKDILSITSVHPMREDAVDKYLDQTGNDWKIIDKMLEQGMLKKTYYKGNTFYLRQLKKSQ